MCTSSLHRFDEYNVLVLSRFHMHMGTLLTIIIKSLYTNYMYILVRPVYIIYVNVNYFSCRTRRRNRLHSYPEAPAIEKTEVTKFLVSQSFLIPTEIALKLLY